MESGIKIKEARALMKKARNKLEAAKRDIEVGDAQNAVSRSYYAAFLAASSLLILKGLEYSSHGQTIGAFGREFVKTNIFPKDFNKILNRLFDDRQDSDYLPDDDLNMEIAQGDFDDAKKILEACVEYLERETREKME